MDAIAYLWSCCLHSACFLLQKHSVLPFRLATSFGRLCKGFGTMPIKNPPIPREWKMLRPDRCPFCAPNHNTHRPSPQRSRRGTERPVQTPALGSHRPARLACGTVCSPAPILMAANAGGPGQFRVGAVLAAAVGVVALPALASVGYLFLAGVVARAGRMGRPHLPHPLPKLDNDPFWCSTPGGFIAFVPQRGFWLRGGANGWQQAPKCTRIL